MLNVQGWAHLPSFDHGVGDPVEKDIYVSTMYGLSLIRLQSTKMVLKFFQAKFFHLQSSSTMRVC